MYCPKKFLPYIILNNNEFKQTVLRKRLKFTHIAKPAISDAENFINAVNSENNITKYFKTKDLNSTFNTIGKIFSLFHLHINLLSFHFNELKSPILKSKYNFQISGISETSLNKTQETKSNIQWTIITLTMYQLNQLMGKCLLYIKKAVK